MIGIVLVREDCFLVYCDKDSEIKKKSVDCPSTTRPVSWFGFLTFKIKLYKRNIVVFYKLLLKLYQNLRTQPQLLIFLKQHLMTTSIQQHQSLLQQLKLLKNIANGITYSLLQVIFLFLNDSFLCFIVLFNLNNLFSGQIIGTVNSDGTCFMVYCDENSEVVNKTVQCTSTNTPEVYKVFDNIIQNYL